MKQQKGAFREDTFINKHYKTELFIVIRLLDTKSRGKCLY